MNEKKNCLGTIAMYGKDQPDEYFCQLEIKSKKGTKEQ